jgi:branched-chain amino acid transport system substrate-binding protein
MRGGRSARPTALLVVVMAAALVSAACSGSDGTADTADSTPEATTPGAGQGEATDGGDQSATADGSDSTATDGVSAGGFDIDAVLAADANCPTPVSGEPLRIGYAADLSEVGGFADAPASQMAAHMAKLINCSGGLAGRPVEVDRVDVSGLDPVVSREGTKGLVDGGASVLLGPPFPDPGFRVLQVADGKVPVIFTGSTEPALGDDSHLSYLVAFSDTQGATAAAQFAQTQGWSTAVTFSSPGPYFGYNPLVFADVFTAQGGRVLGDFPFIPLETTDFADAIAAMADEPPDVIYSAMLANQLVALKEQLAAAGLGAVEVIGTDAFEATNGYALAPGNEGIYHVTHTDPRPGTRLDRLEASFAAANGGVAPSSPSMAALAGDAMAVIADAYLRVGTTDPVAIGQAIATAQGVQGITGILTYDRSGAPSKPMYIHKVVAGQATLAGVIGG